MHRNSEWLEADGLGGYASGTVCGVRTRRYHAWLLASRNPPTDRVVLVNGADVWIETERGEFPLSVQQYAPDVFAPRGDQFLREFDHEPWPQWRWEFPGGGVVTCELLVVHHFSATVLRWRATGFKQARLFVRPFLSGRDYHGMLRENRETSLATEKLGPLLRWETRGDMPSVVALANGVWRDEPLWYRNFVYSVERERQLDDTEDLAAPGVMEYDLSVEEAVLILGSDTALPNEIHEDADPVTVADILTERERTRRAAFATPMDRAADAYIVKRGTGRTIIAGYPWFTDWGRDTFIALRGLCLATGRYDIAAEILLEWSLVVSQGMLPNRFPDSGETPEYNSVDASLWYVVACGEFLAAADAKKTKINDVARGRLRFAIEAILDGYAGGTRYGIKADRDGLLMCGEPGWQLTWMDAKVGDWVVTPRIGKPVEIQALWLNALAVGAQWRSRWKVMLDMGQVAFAEQFWNDKRKCLYDVIDVDGISGKKDQSVRPNQILAVGGLPLALVEGDRARRVVETVEARLLTPGGLRSLAPGEKAYHHYYTGGILERDGRYHQGTAWGWLMGPFIEAWIRVRGETPAAVSDAWRTFVEPLLARMGEAGLGHLPEIADAEPPHTPRGCPFQAWSLSELIRVMRKFE